jgi:hypothetical protein
VKVLPGRWRASRPCEEQLIIWYMSGFLRFPWLALAISWPATRLSWDNITSGFKLTGCDVPTQPIILRGLKTEEMLLCVRLSDVIRI